MSTPDGGAGYYGKRTEKVAQPIISPSVGQQPMATYMPAPLPSQRRGREMSSSSMSESDEGQKPNRLRVAFYGNTISGGIQIAGGNNMVNHGQGTRGSQYNIKSTLDRGECL